MSAVTIKSRKVHWQLQFERAEHGATKSRAERIYAQNLWEQANNSKDIGLPQILEDSAIKALRQQHAVLMADYQNKLSTFKPAYPDMLRLKAQIDQISTEINNAAAVIKQSLKARYEFALQQEVLLKEKMGETKRGVLDTRNKEIQFNILKREADTNRTLYEGLLQQFKDVGVAGAVGTNNVAIIDRAQLPGAPFKPNLTRNSPVFAFARADSRGLCNAPRYSAKCSTIPSEVA